MDILYWDPSSTYPLGSFVVYNSEVYQKMVDGDSSDPPNSSDSWALLASSGVAQFEVIDAQMDSYESRKASHQAKVAADKASAVAKLATAGLTDDEMSALLGDS